MKLKITFNELHNRCGDVWDELCDELGLNPWLLNEGLADGEDTIMIEEEVAKKYGVI